MNEATLEARLHAILLNVFPTFQQVDLKHQGSFSVRFGRRNVKVDLKDPSSYPNRAIYDILLSSGGVNMILVELKEEGHDINDRDDINQGISYARLIDQMPPIVLISNGRDSLFFDTYTKKEIKESSIDMAFIQGRIRNSFKLVTSEFQNAVNFLLNRNPAIVGKVFRNISKSNFSYQSGNTGDILKAISPDFQIYRKVTKRIYRSIHQGHNLIGLIGHAFSGKTNVLFQIFRNYGYLRNHYVLYVNLTDWNFPIFQHLSIEFSKETKTNINREKVRDWFSSLVYTDENARVILLIDNLTKDVTEAVSEEIIEIINIVKDTKHSIVYSIDEWTYNEIAHVENRNYATIIGELSKCFFLKALNAHEYGRMQKQLYKNGYIVQRGGQLSPEFREPRILRNIAALIKRSPELQGGYAVIGAIPTIGMIQEVANNKIFTKDVHLCYKALASVFIAEKEFRDKIPHLSILAPTMGAVSKAGFLHLIGIKEYVKLLKSGLVVEREYRKGLEVLLPKIPELFVFHGVEAVLFFLKDVISSGNYDNVYKEYIIKCSSFPAADLVGVGVLNKIMHIDIDLYSFLIQSLLKDEPQAEVIKAGTRTLMFSEQYGYIHLQFETDMEEEQFIAQHLPYNILSQLFHRVLISEDAHGNQSYQHFVEMVIKVGSYPGLLTRMGYGSYDNIIKVDTWEVKGVGNFYSGRNGVTEAIVQALANVFLEQPELVESIYQIGKRRKAYHLLWRVDLAMRSFTRNYPPQILSKATEIMKDIQAIFFEVFQRGGEA